MEGRTRVTRALKKQRRADELWSGPDQRPKKKCYICRRECVLEGIRWAPRNRRPFICPWCLGRNFKFVWACVMLTRVLAGRDCPNMGKNHSPACKTPQCTARRIMKLRKG